MSKFDAVYKKIEEQLPAASQQQNTATSTQPNQPKPALNPTQQQEVEKLADQLSRINDPKQIKDILATIMQGVTHPQNGVTTQPKPAV
jgi:hypothetical protein